MNKRIFFEIYLQNTDSNDSQSIQQDQGDLIPAFNPSSLKSGGSSYMKISTYAFKIVFVCFYFRVKIQNLYEYLSYVSKYEMKRKVKQNDDSQIKKFPYYYKSLYEVYSIKQLQELSMHQDYYMQKEVSEIRKQRFINKKKDIDQVIQNKLDENLDLDYSEKPVIGSLNYDIILNQKYSRYFDWKTDLTILKMNKAKKEEMLSKLTQSVGIKRQIQGAQTNQSTCKIIQQYKRQIRSRYQQYKNLKKNESFCSQDNQNQIEIITKFDQNQIQCQEKQQNSIRKSKFGSIIQDNKNSQVQIIENQIFSQEELYASIKRIDFHNSIPQSYQFNNINMTFLNKHN
ncbi:hypothetical protein ABPG72_017890 [Tetrahymena utriculariae]